MSKPTLTNSSFRLRAVALAASCGVLLVGCGGGSVTLDNNEPTPAELAAERRATQQKADLAAADTALTVALALTLDTQEELDAANAARTRLTAAITAAADVSAADLAKYENAASNARDRIADAQKIFDEDQADLRARQQAEEQRKAREEAVRIAAMAAKLHAGIAPQNGDPATTAGGNALAAGDRAAAYNTAGTHIHVGIGDADPVPLSEDKDTMVPELHGWTGKRYHRTMPAGEGTYEAHVYSHIGEPTMGDKFNAGLPEVGDLDATSGETGILSTLTGYEALVSSTHFDQSAGIKKFKLPADTVRVRLSGSYYGVSGTYYCTPADNSTCAAQKAAKGFALGSTLDSTNAFTPGDWTFKPNDPNARVMSTPDNSYASYGWWLHTAANGDLTASAFVDRRGAADSATGITALQGTATYRGGAVGKYALSSSTGGTNDAGHFTASATLQADFNDDMITGTIGSFMDGDGNAKDWSVELMKQTITDTGLINGIDGAGAGGASMTKWTIGGKAADPSGNWTGSLQENGDDGVPAIATGTFYTHYSTSGKMVGAFGVNKEE